MHLRRCLGSLGLKLWKQRFAHPWEVSSAAVPIERDDREQHQFHHGKIP